MNKNYPFFLGKEFKCPHCECLAQQSWFNRQSSSSTAVKVIENIYLDQRTRMLSYDQKTTKSFVDIVANEFRIYLRQFVPDSFAVSTCSSCEKITVWIDEEIVYPRQMSIPSPNNDLDQDIQDLYNEAKIICGDSPKGAAALLRLALQKLLKQVGQNGKNINDDIKNLVQNGLDPKIQQALDILRVVGNNAVHPGQIDFKDNQKIALDLFKILNFIADELITKPKEMNSMYNSIVPDETKKHIKQRDSKKKLAPNQTL